MSLIENSLKVMTEADPGFDLGAWTLSTSC